MLHLSHVTLSRLVLALAVVALGGLASGGVAQAQRTAPVFQVRQPFSDSGIASLIVYDLDANLRFRGVDGWGFVGELCINLQPCPQPPVAIGDVDGDGDEEIVTVVESLTTRAIRFYDQSGLIKPPRLEVGGLDGALLAAGDVLGGGDGVDEIIVHRGGEVRVFDDAGTPLSSFQLPPATAAGQVGLAAGHVFARPDGAIVVATPSRVEVFDADGSLASSFQPGAPPIADIALGDTTGDGIDEIVVRDSLAAGASVRIFDASGVLIGGFAIPFEDDVGHLATGDVVGDARDEIFLGLSVFPQTLLDDDLVAFDASGTELARSRAFFLFTPPNPPFPNQGPTRLLVGQRPYPDRDGDGLLDSWETTGIPLVGGVFPLQQLGADPDHKDLYLELDWMPDATLAERGNGSVARPIGPTCGDGADNDGDGAVDGADVDCYAPNFREAGSPSCGDGVDNDGDGLADANDSDCLIGSPGSDEGGAGPATCSDGVDNDGDGNTDLNDLDCRVLFANLTEGSGATCSDGFDDDADGLTDASDPDCVDDTLAEAAAGSCGDGFDNDGDGFVDLSDLDCRHAPSQLDVRRMEAAFCAAPVDAGGVPNADGVPGIDLHVDTGILHDPNGAETPVGPCTCADGVDNDLDGLIDFVDPDCRSYDPSLTEPGPVGSTCRDGIDNNFDGLPDALDPQCQGPDPLAAETSSGPGTCSDGVDNDVDGLPDAADPDCFVGDVRTGAGGGNELPFTQICDLGDAFYDLKKDHFANFVPARKLVFRYAISAAGCGTGGQGEVGGNDFAEFNHDAGTIMHELGHTLNLRHGGDENHNCKPNYVSVMNYDDQFRIRQVGGVDIVDYSPPRFYLGRGAAPIQTLVEDQLDEGVVLDGSDAFNRFVFKDATGMSRVWPLDGDIDGDGASEGVDWDGDGDLLGSGPVNIDAAPPNACSNGSSDGTLTGHHDWDAIVLPFRVFGDSEDGAVNPETSPELNRDELMELEQTLLIADLSIAKVSDRDPVEVGDPLTYTLTVSDGGPGPANAVRVRDRLPARADYASDTAGCTLAGADLDCSARGLEAGQSVAIDVVLDTDRACIDGLPTPLTNLASVQNVDPLAGADPNALNDAVSLVTETVDTTPPVIQCNAPATIVPPDGGISFRATAMDVCDDAVRAEISAFDCFKFTQKDKRVDKTRSCEVSFAGDSITIFDTGGVDDHITWTVSAVDRSGNEAVSVCEVLVVNPSQ